MRRPLRRVRPGFTLHELLIVLVLAAVLASWTAFGLARYREAKALDGAVGAVRAHLLRARGLGLARREVVRLRIREGRLTTYSDRDEPLHALPLFREPFLLDSARLAPRTLRYNGRGQASPGSVYLYRGSKGARIVSNFVGRIRVERFDP